MNRCADDHVWPLVVLCALLAAVLAFAMIASALAGLLGSGGSDLDRTGAGGHAARATGLAPVRSRGRVADRRPSRAPGRRRAARRPGDLADDRGGRDRARLAAGKPHSRRGAAQALRQMGDSRRSFRSARPSPDAGKGHARVSPSRADRRRGAGVGDGRRADPVGQDHRAGRARDERVGRSRASRRRSRPTSCTRRSPRAPSSATPECSIPPRPPRWGMRCGRRSARRRHGRARGAPPRRCSASATTTPRGLPTTRSGAQPARATSPRCCSRPPRPRELTMADVLHWIATSEFDEPTKLLDASQ